MDEMLIDAVKDLILHKIANLNSKILHASSPLNHGFQFKVSASVHLKWINTDAHLKVLAFVYMNLGISGHG